MKIILTILLGSFVSFTVHGQARSKYNIKVVEQDNRQTRGVFYAVNAHELIVVKHQKDTLKLSLVGIKDLYISKRGVILPFMLVGAGIFLVAAAEAKLPLDQFVNLVAGVPVGAIVGNLVGQLFANKRLYKGLVIADFPNIRTDLENYTQIITQP